MRQIDENFDGRISYKELKDHILSMGFNLPAEDTNKVATIASNMKKKIETFNWRDKGIEIIVRSLNNNLHKKPMEDFFK